jgi:hypothetical protein
MIPYPSVLTCFDLGPICFDPVLTNTGSQTFPMMWSVGQNMVKNHQKTRMICGQTHTDENMKTGYLEKQI